MQHGCSRCGMAVGMKSCMQSWRSVAGHVHRVVNAVCQVSPIPHPGPPPMQAGSVGMLAWAPDRLIIALDASSTAMYGNVAPSTCCVTHVKQGGRGVHAADQTRPVVSGGGVVQGQHAWPARGRGPSGKIIISGSSSWRLAAHTDRAGLHGLGTPHVLCAVDWMVSM